MDLNPLQITLIGLLVTSLLAQLAYYWGIFARLAFYKEKEPASHNLPPVSVVIAARNEYHHLKKSLPVLLTQDYPEYEVIVVNHVSEDETADYLKEMQQTHPRLKVVNIERDLNFFHGKKFPLSIGIKSAAHDILLLTDADCMPASNQWVKTMASHYGVSTEIVLGVGPYQKEKGFLNGAVRYDTFFTAMQYLSYALAGLPYMGVGRNLSYRKELFFKYKGFISHYKVASGDDDLFINQAAQSGNTQIEISPESFVYSEPKHSWHEWFTQKRRHLSAGNKYKTRFKLLLGAYSFSLGIFYLTIVLLLTSKSLIYIPIGAISLRLISQIIIHSKILKRLQDQQLLLFSLLWEPVYLLMFSFMGIVGLWSKSVKWK